MTQPNRDADYVDAFLARVAEGWGTNPDSRFGQFVSNIVRMSSGKVGQEPRVEDITDEGFLRALDAWVADAQRRREEFERDRRERRRDSVDPRIKEGVKQTQRMYDRWALETFGRIGRDPTRIDPFLRTFAKVWLGRPHFRFGELTVSVLPLAEDPEHPERLVRSGLRLIEDNAFLALIEYPDVLSADEIEDRYFNRGPLGDLLARLKPPGEG